MEKNTKTKSKCENVRGQVATATFGNTGKLFCADCMEILPDIPDKSVQLILCDLPYGVSASAWDKTLPMSDLWREYARILADDGTIALFCIQPFTSRLITCEKPRNMKYRYMWVWLKGNVTGYGNSHHQPLRGYEEIAVFGRGRGKYNPQGLRLLETPIEKHIKKGGVYRPNSKSYQQFYTNYPTNILEFKSANAACRSHPNAKPVELLRYLVRTYTDTGDVVLDNTMGSGATCVAATLEQRNYIGIEKEQKYYETAVRRVVEAGKEVESEDLCD